MTRIGWLLLAVALTACNLPTDAGLTPTQAAAIAPSQAAPTQEPIATPTLVAPPTFTRSHYRLIATLDFPAHYLAVSQQISYTNNTSQILEQIPLVVPVADDFISVTEIDFDRGADWDYSGGLDGGLVELTLARPLLPGEQLLIEIEFNISVPERATTLGWTARQITFIDWYPFIPPYDADTGWMINQPAQQGEYLVYESADFDVSIYKVSPPSLLQIAAPAPAEQVRGAHIYQLSNARRFVWSASGHYQTLSEHAGERNIPVTVYFFEEERIAAEAALRTAVRALEIYENLFGPYPYESLAVVECLFPDGMESDGIFFLDRTYFRAYDLSNRNLLVTLSAHETAHNWWFGAVGNDAGNAPWLDEALATYSELLFYEQAHPFDTNWWWEFRVDQWAPSGPVDSTAYQLPSFRPYVNAVYLRGAHFLHEVRAAMGTEAFFAFVQDYFAQNLGRIASPDDFLSLLQGATDQDLSEIIGEYFR